MKEIQLTQGKVAIVDDEDCDELNKHKWYVHKEKNNFYAERLITIENGKRTLIKMHRQIMKFPKGFQIDHINHDGLDNRKENLRICSHIENCRNKISTNGFSKYKGAYWHKPNKKWLAQISYNNKTIYIGSFVDEIEAAKAYDKKAVELFGEFAYLNFKPVS